MIVLSSSITGPRVGSSWSAVISMRKRASPVATALTKTSNSVLPPASKRVGPKISHCPWGTTSPSLWSAGRVWASTICFGTRARISRLVTGAAADGDGIFAVEHLQEQPRDPDEVRAEIRIVLDAAIGQSLSLDAAQTG